MDFRLVIVVLLAYFIRPQDWIGGLSGFNIMKPLMAITLLAMFTRRRGFSPSSLVKNPVDWAMIAYAVFIVATAPQGQRPLASVFILIAYYLVTSQALSTSRQLIIYLRCWLLCLMVVAAMALASEYGLDLTGAREITYMNPEDPRLVLNTYLFNNPNALGHSVIIAIPLAYFLLFWKGPMRQRLMAAGSMLLAGYCVYLTKSKGAYIVGFSIIVVSLMLGRSILFQVITLLIAATVGLQALKALPRMADIDRARQDEAIMGRMLVWEQARMVADENPNGIGFQTFTAVIEYENQEVEKATHSSYVLVCAELGPRGMFFYLAVLYAALRILLTTRCNRQEDEASRRAMITILVGYMASSWLIDRAYHLEYFLLAGAVSAFHRRLSGEFGLRDPAAEGTEITPVLHEPEGTGSCSPAPGWTLCQDTAAGGTQVAAGPSETSATPADVDASDACETLVAEKMSRFWHWRRWGVIDVLLTLVLTKIVLDTWNYLLNIYFQ